MAIEIKVRKAVAPARFDAQAVSLPPDVVLPRTTRINLTLRRRRLRRLHNILEAAAWVTGGVMVLGFVAASILTLH